MLLPHLPASTYSGPPGHTSLPSNEHAHAVAHKISLWSARRGEATSSGWGIHYRDILRHYTRIRCTHCVPPPSFSQEEAVALCQLQIETSPNIVSLNKFYLHCYADNSPGCGRPPSIFHVTIECTANHFPLLPTVLYPLCK